MTAVDAVEDEEVSTILKERLFKIRKNVFEDKLRELIEMVHNFPNSTDYRDLIKESVSIPSANDDDGYVLGFYGNP